MRWEDLRSSSNVEDRRGEGGGGGGIGFPGGGAGGLGIGTIVVLLIISYFTGINPAILIGGAERMGGGNSRQEQADPQTQAKRRQAPTDQSGQFASKILGNTEDVWSQILPQQTGKQYTPTTLVLYTGGTRSGCGSAQAAMGPFYCPLDKKVYLDTNFFKEMAQKFGVKGDFAYAYVIAHEVGHHVQDVLGILPKVQARQQRASSKAEANALSVRVELMADCLAGVWAKNSNDKYAELEQGDVEEALNAAAQIGDDALQKRSQGYAVPDSFTHGSSAQRQRWFMAGYKSGQTKACDTFRSANN
ncbi:neutral zinc metallopeptidase [Methylobacterium sp. NEAU 140]|uniref:KPN_02809 family neutral zinc metallopeptidase n=1 Tax=Methylobacterium sp. NEAU 140 TaxID=3064945 RepID=UPI002733F314|nr:neutral zinc metallopeptidase [Methylobacterium sp. NEAU 140]MDP4027030.1 neutral zinc metallopeptidase [Methylobacterium sp. NEAU 140]